MTNQATASINQEIAFLSIDADTAFS